MFYRLACATVVSVLTMAPAVGADLASGMLAFDQGDYDSALAEWRPLADAGDPTAQSLLGMMYRGGEGVGRDAVAAAAWYRRAAMQGHPYAQYNLGDMYRTGEGVAADLAQAYVWFALAAQQIPRGADGTSSASRARDAVAAGLDGRTLQDAQEQVDAFVVTSE